MIKLSFDGKGINLASNEYSPRVATFNANLIDAEYDRKALGALFENAPEMLAMLERLYELHGYVDLADLIAKAKGR